MPHNPITHGPDLEGFLGSIAPPIREGGSLTIPAIGFTVPFAGSGVAGGWVWDGCSDHVCVRVTLIERLDAADDGPDQNWRFKGRICSMYDGLDGTPVEGQYSTVTKTGFLSIIR